MTFALAIVFAGIQFYRPEISNPPVDSTKAWTAHVRMTPEVSAILDRSCKDCHSNNTRRPWYSYVAPISWKVASDVRSARRKLNFSEIKAQNGQDPARRVSVLLGELKSEVEDGEMPLPSYLWMHPNAALSPSEVMTLSWWADSEQQRLAANP